MECAREPYSRSAWSHKVLSDDDERASMQKALVDVVEASGWSVLFPNRPFPGVASGFVVVKQTPYLTAWEHVPKEAMDKWQRHVDKMCVHLKREALILDACRGKHVCELVYVVESSWRMGAHAIVPSVSIVLKHYDQMDLFHRASYYQSLCDKTYVGFRLLRDLAMALELVHSRGYLHRDVKPENVLIDEDGSLVLCDFDLAHTKHGPECGTLLGTRSYLAPEVAYIHELYDDQVKSLWSRLVRPKRAVPSLPNDLRRATEKSDVFSAAVTLYSVLVNYGLVDPSSQECIAMAGSYLYYDVYLKQNETKLHPDLFLLLKRMLSYSADDRPTVRDIVDICKLHVQ